MDFSYENTHCYRACTRIHEPESGSYFSAKLKHQNGRVQKTEGERVSAKTVTSNRKCLQAVQKCYCLIAGQSSIFKTDVIQ